MTSQDIKTLSGIITSMQNQLFEQLTEFKSDIDQQFATFKAEMDSQFQQVDAGMFGIENRAATKEDLEAFATKADFEDLKNTLDTIVANTEVNTDERLALSAQVTRLEDWAVRTAPVVGVEYTSGA